jgi:CheY-like chemotaxis protein
MSRKTMLKEDLKMETVLRKILIVDDNQTIRCIIAQMLSRLGYDVISTDSGENGLELFLKNQFDLVITDLEMSGMDGIALAGHIKEKSPFTLVILMTGQGKEVTLAKIKASSLDQALFKPFYLTEIQEKIQSVLNRWQSGARQAI